VTRLRAFGIEMIGWVLLALAVFVLPLPVIPSLLAVAALGILATRYSWASRMLGKLGRWFPAMRLHPGTIAPSEHSEAP
jgi:Putative transmembrane protein (PGPGW)